MIDRIEELLSKMAAEDEEEQREDVLARRRGAAVSGGLRPERGESGEASEGRTASAQPESLGRAADGRGVAAGEAEAERPKPINGETAAEPAQASRELWKDGPVWTVRGAGSEIAGARRIAASEQTARTEEAIQPARNGASAWAGVERAARDGTTDSVLNSVGRFGSVQAGLAGLYRQTVQSLRPAAPALPPKQTGEIAGALEPESAASLAVDELDRAVRRDSRRYDGGMNIY